MVDDKGRRKIKIFADGANKDKMIAAYRNREVDGFTTNPTLMNNEGIKNYEAFAREVLAVITDTPISFEVFSDDLSEMERQAMKIASWGENVYVKIPVTNTLGVFTGPIIKKLSHAWVKLNITAVFTLAQVQSVLQVLSPATPAVISIFAGRIANAGVDPMPIMQSAVLSVKWWPLVEILWASPREALNVVQAEECGCHIITVTGGIQQVMDNDFGKDLAQFSLETVKMFRQAAVDAGFQI